MIGFVGDPLLTTRLTTFAILSPHFRLYAPGTLKREGSTMRFL